MIGRPFFNYVLRALHNSHKPFSFYKHSIFWAKPLKEIEIITNEVDRDSGGELGRRDRAGKDILSVSLPARAQCPDDTSSLTLVFFLNPF